MRFSERLTAAQRAWDRYCAETRPPSALVSAMPATFHAGFTLGLAEASEPDSECSCTPHDQDAGGGYTEHLLEMDPACPVHSDCLWDPRAQHWVSRPWWLRVAPNDEPTPVYDALAAPAGEREP